MSLTEDYIEKRKQAINKFVQAEIRKQLQPVINQLLREPVESTNWRLDRAIRRIIRRDILRDCRQRARLARLRKRRRKQIGHWWLESISSRFRINENGFYVPYASNGGREVVVGIIDDPDVMHPDKIARVEVAE